jgi:hypothetical protein
MGWGPGGGLYEALRFRRKKLPIGGCFCSYKA